MTILPNHAPSSKRPRNHDLGNDLTELNEDARNVRSKVVSVEHDMHEIKEVLQNSLDGISTAADRDWAFGGPLLRAANPGLTLPKSGIVGLPLSLHDVFRIRDEARGGMSDIDKPKLNGENSSCWTLSAEQFGVRNPAWAAFVKDFVWETFGSSAGLYQIDLIGLKLEEASESSSVEGVPDSTVTEPVAKPYITLELYLPSMHTGGLLKYTFGSESKTFDTSVSSEFDITYVASYSDVNRSSQPIQSGYRLQLEYRIYNPGYQQIETASSLASYAQDFEAALKDWTTLWKAGSALPLLVYILEDETSPHEVPSPKATELKTQYLQERCANQGICAFSASLRSTIQVGSSDDAELVLEELRGLDGRKVPGFTASITLDQIIQTDYFEGRESNDSDYGREDAFEEVDEHHFKDPVSPRFFLDNRKRVVSHDMLDEVARSDDLEATL